LYIRVPRLESEQQWRRDAVLNVIGTRQYMDWQKLRHVGLTSTEASLAIERFCGNIFSALNEPWISPEERRHNEETEARQRAEGDRRREAEAIREAEDTERQTTEAGEAARRAEGVRRQREADAKQRADEHLRQAEAVIRQHADEERARREVTK